MRSRERLKSGSPAAKSKSPGSRHTSAKSVTKADRRSKSREATSSVSSRRRSQSSRSHKSDKNEDATREKSTSATGKRMMAHADVIRGEGLELVDLSEQGLTFVPTTTFQSK